MNNTYANDCCSSIATIFYALAVAISAFEVVIAEIFLATAGIFLNEVAIICPTSMNVAVFACANRLHSTQRARATLVLQCFCALLHCL